MACAGLSLGFVALLGALVLAGCGGLTGKLTGTTKANLPPHTVLFVNGALDTVNHIVHLYWFGTDPDGVVQGFEWQLLNPADTTDKSWHFTTQSDSVFTVFTPAGYTNPVFSVRAIDNAGARDPSPPRQTFGFSNQAPTVKLLQKPLPTDTTFASVSVTWSASDLDGDVGRLTYLVWLDGNQATPEITTAQALTMPTERFKVAGALTSAKRTLFVRAIDDGGRAGPADSVSWFVRKPVTGARARLLLVDDVPKTNAANLRFDTLYSNSVGRVGLTTDQYTILRLDTTQPFKTAADFEQTFKLFETVVWYRGNETTLSTLLGLGEPGIGNYLSAGGKFYLDGLYLFRGVNANGALSEGFVRNHLDSFGLVGAFTTTSTFADTSVGFGNTGTSVFLPAVDVRGTLVRDSMYVRQAFVVRSGEAAGLRQFEFRDRREVVLWGAPGTLTPAVGDSTAVGISVAQPGGGRAVVVCMPPGGAVPPVGAGTQAGSAARFVTNILRHLGLDLP
jgi:fluoride ion exporter CrcB/FEX